MIFLVDRCLGRSVHRRLEEAHPDHIFKHGDDCFPQDAEDREWIEVAGKEGWVVLTADGRIRYHELERAAVEAGKLRMFLLTVANAGREEKASILVGALPRIVARCETPGPWIVKVYKEGRLAQWWPPKNIEHDEGTHLPEP